LSRETVANEALREIRRRCHEFKGDIELKVHPHVAEVFKGVGAKWLSGLERRINKKIVLEKNARLHQEGFDIRAAKRQPSGKEG